MSSIGRIVKRNHSALFWCSRQYPKAKREAVYTLYALIKHFDDLCLSSLSTNDKKDILSAWKREIDNIYDKKVPETDIGRRIYKNCMRYKFSRQDLENILSSFSLDCPEPMFCPTLDVFEQYCYGVAEIPSFLILKVVSEFDEETCAKIGSEIGRAVEVTNILKNIKEDMISGHVYIPREFLEHAQININLSAKEILTHKNLYVARQKMADIARKSFDKAYALLKESNNHNSKPVIYMLNHYHTYFQMMENRGWEIISPKPELRLKERIKLIISTLFYRMG